MSNQYLYSYNGIGAEVALLFDLDGVLIDSEREYTKIWRKIEEVYPTGKEDFASSIKGMTLDKILADNFNEPEVRQHVTDMLYMMEKEMIYSYCPGAEAFIKRIVETQVPRAIVTSSNEDKMSHLYKDIPEFCENFPIIIDSSFVKKSKPNPEGYLIASKKTGVGIRHCAVFEDSVQGVMAGKASGAYVIGITGTKPFKELQPYCDVIVDSLAEINLTELLTILKERE